MSSQLVCPVHQQILLPSPEESSITPPASSCYPLAQARLRLAGDPRGSLGTGIQGILGNMRHQIRSGLASARDSPVAPACSESKSKSCKWPRAVRICSPNSLPSSVTTRLPTPCSAPATKTPSSSGTHWKHTPRCLCL